MTAEMRATTRWALAVIAGFINGAAFVYAGELALLANVPLLVALCGATSPLLAAGLGGVVGFIGGLHIYGILDYGWLLFWGFASYTGGQMVLYALVVRGLWRHLGSTARVALPALTWALTEWLRTVGPLSMPASYVGCVADVAWLHPWLALAAWTGGLGVSTLIALFQSAVFHALIDVRAYARPLIACAGLVVTTGLWGILSPPPLGETPIRVVGAQGGLPNYRYSAAEADPAIMRDIVGTYETLSRRAFESGADLVVWPETAVRAPVLQRPELRARLFPRSDERSVLIAGMPVGTGDGHLRNSAVAIAPGGHVIDRYDKVRLVPDHEAEYAAGPSWTPLDTPVGRIGVMICLESVYPQAGRSLTDAGAELLVVMSNDAGFGYTPISRHMINRAIVRAVENGRWLLRVGQAGISTLIDPRGRTHGRLELFEPGLLEGTARLRRDRTFGTRFGQWLIIAIAAGLAATTVSAIRRARRLRRTKA